MMSQGLSYLKSELNRIIELILKLEDIDLDELHI